MSKSYYLWNLKDIILAKNKQVLEKIAVLKAICVNKEALQASSIFTTKDIISKFKSQGVDVKVVMKEELQL